MWFFHQAHRDQYTIKRLEASVKYLEEKANRQREIIQKMAKDEQKNREWTDSCHQKISTYGYIFRDTISAIERCSKRYPRALPELQKLITELKERRLACEGSTLQQFEYLLSYLTDQDRHVLRMKLGHDDLVKQILHMTDTPDEIPHDTDPDEEDQDGNALDKEGNER